jgi:hypothetical protein
MHATGSVECSSCGYRNPSRPLVRAMFDEDLVGTRAMLAGNPLTEACSVCGSPVTTATAATFLDPERRFAAALMIGPRDHVILDELRRTSPGWRFDVQRQANAFNSVVGGHLEKIATDAQPLVAEALAAARDESGAKQAALLARGEYGGPTRSTLNALDLVGGSRQRDAHEIAPGLATLAAFRALRARTDAVAALDASVPSRLIGDRAIARLVGMGMGMGAASSLGPAPGGFPQPAAELPIELGAAPMVAAAWASDRTGTAFSPPGPAVWATCVIDWFELRPDAPTALGPDDFLRRTVDHVQIANVLVMKSIGRPDRVPLVDLAERKGLLGGIDFTSHISQVLGPDWRRR